MNTLHVMEAQMWIRGEEVETIDWWEFGAELMYTGRLKGPLRIVSLNKLDLAEVLFHA